MHFLKRLFKIFAKWLLMLFVTTGQAEHTSADGSFSNASQNGHDPDKRETLSALNQAFNRFEQELDRKLDAFTQSDNPPMTSENTLLAINDLRAEMASLRAEIRFLQRMLSPNPDIP